MFKSCTIYADLGNYKLSALQNEDDSYSMPSFCIEDIDFKEEVYWDNEIFLYEELYQDLIAIERLEIQLSELKNKFQGKYPEIDVEHIEELQEMFEEAERIGFFEDVITKEK